MQSKQKLHFSTLFLETFCEQEAYAFAPISTASYVRRRILKSLNLTESQRKEASTESYNSREHVTQVLRPSVISSTVQLWTFLLIQTLMSLRPIWCL